MKPCSHARKNRTPSVSERVPRKRLGVVRVTRRALLLPFALDTEMPVAPHPATAGRGAEMNSTDRIT
jgi:hypothetical protein